LYETAAIINLHVNPGSQKERGHFGSQIQRKGTGILQVSKKDDISTVSTKMLRSLGDTNQIHLKYDPEYGYHREYFINGDVIDEKAKNRIAYLNGLTKKSFTDLSSLSKKDAVGAIMKRTATAEKNSQNILKELIIHGFLEIGEDGFYRKKSGI
jgi:hypothetical protein